MFFQITLGWNKKIYDYIFLSDYVYKYGLD